ncbi:unknown [Clostridium sp. CAG:921]|nr:unknown [Clostridium sp. CAG:921]
MGDYTGSASIAEDMKWFNKDYFDKGYSSTNKNMKAVSYLLDKAIWTDKFKGNGTEYVVGGPSLDMVLTSYNQSTNQSNVYQSRAENSIGYKLSYDGGTNWKDYMQDSSKCINLELKIQLDIN